MCSTCSRRLAFLLLFVTVATSVVGCSDFRPGLWYLHNENNQKEMEKLEKNWAAFKDENAGLWPTLVRNQQRIAQAGLLTQRIIDEALVSTRHRTILMKEWKELRTKAKTIHESLKKAQADFEKERKSNATSIKELQVQIEQLKKQKKDGEELVDAALRNRQAWEAKLQLYERGSQELLVRDARRRRGLEVRKFSEIFKELFQEEVVVYNSKGNSEIKKVGDVLKDDPDIRLGRWFAEQKKPEDFLKLLKDVKDFEGFQPPPGIDHAILSLAADLTRIKLARIRLTEDFLRQKQSFDPQHEAAIGWSETVLNRIDKMDPVQQGQRVLDSLENSLGRVDAVQQMQRTLDSLESSLGKEDAVQQMQRVLDSLESSLGRVDAVQQMQRALDSLESSLGKEDAVLQVQRVLDSLEAMPDTQGFLQLLQYFVLAEDHDNRTKHLLDIKLATLTHQYELRASTINAQEREALLDRGLQALATYHAGGISEQEIATIYRAVQVAALFRIADKNDVTIKGER